jgi:hypothetical protein
MPAMRWKVSGLWILLLLLLLPLLLSQSVAAVASYGACAYASFGCNRGGVDSAFFFISPILPRLKEERDDGFHSKQQQFKRGGVLLQSDVAHERSALVRVCIVEESLWQLQSKVMVLCVHLLCGRTIHTTSHMSCRHRTCASAETQFCANLR